MALLRRVCMTAFLSATPLASWAAAFHVSAPAARPGLSLAVVPQPALGLAPRTAAPAFSVAPTVSALAAPTLPAPVLRPAAPAAALAAPAAPAEAAPPAARAVARSLSAISAGLPSLRNAVTPGEASRAARVGFDGASKSGPQAVHGYGLELPAPRPRGASLLRRAAKAPSVDGFVDELVAVLVRSGGDPAKAEAGFIEVLARAHAAGQLEPVLQALVADPRAQKLLPPMPEAKRAEYAAQAAFMMGAELEGAGKIPGVEPFEPWEAMGRRHMDLVHASDSRVADPRFAGELEALTGASFSDSNRAKPLIDGPASFRLRFSLMRRAKKSIHVLSWAFYDDATGEAAADLLIAKKREGLDVKVMVDGKTARVHGGAVLARMKAAGVEVVLFQEGLRRYDGLHAKAVLVDGRFAVAGGMNFGDPYSHMGEGPKWRDTDMFYSGPAALETARYMAAVWNAQVLEQGLPYGAMSVPAAGRGKGSARMAFLGQDPGGEATILLAYLKAISGASRVINIENAYFIEMPALRQALLEALARGVQVNILTNSAESIDEPIVTAPILASLPELIRAGAKVSLKRGDTLHSKFMTVDGAFSILGSFNLHPRSVRYEREIALMSLDARFAAELDAAFAADMAKAQAVADPSAVAVPDSVLIRIVRRYLYNQL